MLQRISDAILCHIPFPCGSFNPLACPTTKSFCRDREQNRSDAAKDIYLLSWANQKTSSKYSSVLETTMKRIATAASGIRQYSAGNSTVLSTHAEAVVCQWF